MEDKADRLSELPEHLIDHILLLLSIKDAVKTSMLSRKWRYRWTTLPELVFDDLRTPTSSDAQSSNSVLGKIISDVLLIHTGPLRKFVISHKKFHADSDISRWCYYLSRVSLKELVLNFSVSPWCKIPSSLFSCQELVCLNLCSCSINLPTTFGGFKHLKRMELSSCLVSQDGLERLILSCPLLENMMLKNVDRQISPLHISAPKLRHLGLYGTVNLKDVSFGANHLTSGVISFSVDINEDGVAHVNQSYSSFINFFSQLPLIARLSVGRYLLKPRQSSRQGNADAGYGFWERHRSPCPSLQLRVAAIFGILGTRLELGLIRFVLENSPFLKKIFTAGPSPAPSTSQLLKDLLQIERASPCAQVVHLDAKDTIGDKLGQTFLSLHND
ncbi:hypothetical protein CDL15_Pgr006836 [Punica granatum]|nr:hypothetical protein CDL15_Pgr006836 [Punica granatum]